MNASTSSIPPSFGRLFMAGPRPRVPKVRVAADGSVGLVELPMDFAGLDLVKFYLLTPPGKGGTNVGLRWSYLDRFAADLRLKRTDKPLGNFRHGRFFTSPRFFLKLGWSPDLRRLPPEGGHHMLCLRPSDFDTAGDLLRFLRRLVVGWDPACTYLSELHVCLNGTARFMDTLRRVHVANVRNIYPWEPDEIKVSPDDEGPGPPSPYDFKSPGSRREYELHSSTVYFGGRKSLFCFYDKDREMKKKHDVDLGGGPLTRIEERRRGRQHLGALRTISDLAGFVPSSWFQRLRDVDFKQGTGGPKALRDLRKDAKEVGHTMAVAMQRHRRNLGRDIAPWVDYRPVTEWLAAADRDLRAFWKRAPLAATPTRKTDLRDIAKELAERLRVDAKKSTKASNGALAAALLHSVLSTRKARGSKAMAKDLLRLNAREGGLSTGKCMTALNLYEAVNELGAFQWVSQGALAAIAGRIEELGDDEAVFIEHCHAIVSSGGTLTPGQRDFIGDLWDCIFKLDSPAIEDPLSPFVERVLDLIEAGTAKLPGKIPFVPDREYLPYKLKRLLLRLEDTDADLGLLSQWLFGYIGRFSTRNGLDGSLNRLHLARSHGRPLPTLVAVLLEKAKQGAFTPRPRLASDDL